MFSLQKKKTSSQEIQKSTAREINENMSMNNHNRTDMQKRMMSEHEMSTASFTTKLSQKSFMIKQKNKMRIISTNLKQK